MPKPIENAASQIMGAFKTTKAALENLSGVFKQLEKEHGEVTALLLRLKLTSNATTREELFPTIRKELLSHEAGELAAVYPVFREHENLLPYAAQHEREAATLERTIARLTGMAYDDPQWGPTFADMVDAVTHHVKEEESEFFPVANRELGKEVGEQLKARYLEAKADAMKRVTLA